MIPLLSIELERMGVSSLMNGINTAAGGIATIIIAPFVPFLAARFGLKQVLRTSVALAIVTILAFNAYPHFWVWFGVRFVFGAALGVLFVLSEYWITSTAEEARRGLVVGLYSTVLAIGFIIGPMVLAASGTFGWPPYLAAAALFSLAFAPLWLTPDTAPPLESRISPTIMPLIRVAPAATLAALIFGALETSSFSQFPIYGLRLGLDDANAALLVSYAALGNLLFQIPIGWLSDKMDRRKVLFCCASLGVIGNSAMLLVPVSSNWFLALLVAWGGITGAIYTVGLAHLGSRFSGSDMAIANSAFVMLYSVGLIAGPPLVGSGMDFAGPQGMPVILGSMLAAYAALVLWRIKSHRI